MERVSGESGSTECSPLRLTDCIMGIGRWLAVLRAPPSGTNRKVDLHRLTSNLRFRRLEPLAGRFDGKGAGSRETGDLGVLSNPSQVSRTLDSGATHCASSSST